MEIVGVLLILVYAIFGVLLLALLILGLSVLLKVNARLKADQRAVSNAEASTTTSRNTSSEVI